MSSMKLKKNVVATANGMVMGTADYSKLHGFIYFQDNKALKHYGSKHFGIRTYNHGDGSIILDHHNGGRLELNSTGSWTFTFKYNPEMFIMDDELFKKMINEYLAEAIGLSGADSYSITSAVLS